MLFLLSVFLVRKATAVAGAVATVSISSIIGASTSYGIIGFFLHLNDFVASPLSPPLLRWVIGGASVPKSVRSKEYSANISCSSIIP